MSLPFSTIQAQSIGIVSAVQTQTLRGGVAIPRGADIFLNDEIRTNNTGLGQFLFRDQSTFKVGPNSVVVIDEFIYSPATPQQGSSSITFSRGTGRLIGGFISKRRTSNVRTPHMIVGVQGGIMDLEATEGQSQSILRFGVMTCQTPSDFKVVTQPGFRCQSSGGAIDVNKSPDDALALLDNTDVPPGSAAQPGNGPNAELELHCGRGFVPNSPDCEADAGRFPEPGRFDSLTLPDPIFDLDIPTPVVQPKVRPTTTPGGP